MVDVYAILVPELVNDPLTRGYSGMTNEAILTSLNTTNRTKDVDVIGGQVIFECVPGIGYTGLTADDKQLFNAIIGMGNIDIRGANTRAALARIFPANTVARTNLLALQTTPCTRMSELGLSNIGLGHIESARALGGV